MADPVRSFVDLRAFARQAQAAADLSGGRGLPLSNGPVGVAALHLTGEGRMPPMPADVFVIVLSGALSIGDATIGIDRSIVLPAATAIDWRAPAGATIVTMRCASGAAGADAPVAIDEAAALAPSGTPLAELLVGPTPSCRNHTDYRSASGEFVCGTWDSTPYYRLPMRYGHHELMHLLDGSVTFEDEAGRRRTFTTGDVFLVEQGASCSWLSTDHVKKVYAIYRPA